MPHRELGLTDAEYERICELIEREPNEVELAMFSLLWSEHCAYKHSRKLLRRLPTEGERVVMGPGENAGAVDVGNGYAAAFKVESHNHPSAVEPFQGAATGVGGILRDVFALGARPIAVLDSLRFGELDSERSRYLLDGAVRGIGAYGNSIGVPTVGGEIYFEAPYEHNCLVNAMCVGLARTDEMVRAAARRARQRRRPDGRLDRARRDRRRLGARLGGARGGRRGSARRVQIGDPFEESKLLECCLELLERGLLVSLQDLGAAGLTSSAGEMASAGGVGIDIDVGRVPLREADMEPFEMMVSESQERMLAVVEPARRRDGAGGLREVADRRRGDRRGHRQRPDPGPARRRGGRRHAGRGARRRVPALRPRARRARAAGPTATERRRSAAATPTPATPLLGAAALAQRRLEALGLRAVRLDRRLAHRAPARGRPTPRCCTLPEAGNAIAVAIDGNGRRVACDPTRGAIEAVLECAANLACVGAEPLGVTNCLNFGNPEKPRRRLAARARRSTGLAEACEALGVPVVGGNVSLYNEGREGPIYPTPVIGMVGELPDPAPRRAAAAFAREGDAIALVGPVRALAGRLGAGEAARRARPRAAAGSTLERVARGASRRVREAVRSGALASAHDVSDGGLACALAESAIAGGIGCRIDLDPLVEERGGSGETALFGEGPGGFVISGARASARGARLGALPCCRSARSAATRSRSRRRSGRSRSRSPTPSAPGARWPSAPRPEPERS